MKIKKIILKNFRCFERLEVNLKSKINLIIGENGSGKSAILDALSVGLGAIATHLPDVSGISFKKNDIRQINDLKFPYVKISLETVDGINWDVSQKRDKSKHTLKKIPPSKGIKALTNFLDTEIIDKHNNRADFELPLFAYYGVSRAMLDIPLRRTPLNKKPSRFDALADALNADSRFRPAFMWFYNKENEEHRLQKEKKSFDVTLKELDVVRNAIAKIFPDMADPHIEVNPLRFMIRKDDETLSLDQLSDGYKTMLGMIMDLSSRFAMANPHLDNPSESEAIVMIDEIDLHLHPAWQQRVIGDLIRVFPNAQFILTTHSPYILEALNNHLKKEKIKKLLIECEDIAGIEPVNQAMVQAFMLEQKGGLMTPIIDETLGLIDDKLLSVFNDINGRYDRMRDMEWENSHD